MILFALLLLAGTGAAGYLGYRSSRQETAAIEAPPTVAAVTCDVQKTVTAPGNLVATRQIKLEMPAEGRLAEVLVWPGEAVKAGQVLARLEGRASFAQAVQNARAELLEAQQKLEALPRQAHKEAAQAQVDLLEAQKKLDEAVRWRAYLGYPEEQRNRLEMQAQQHYQQAQKEYTRALNTYTGLGKLPEKTPKGARALQLLNTARLARDRAQAELDRLSVKSNTTVLAKADASLTLAQARLAELTGRLAELKDGPAAADQAQAEAHLAQAQASLAEAQRVLDSVTILAPAGGVVLEAKASAGQNLAKGSLLFILADPAALEVQASVIEEDLPLVQPGMAVNLFFDALPEAQASGRVARIVPQRMDGDRPLYPVYIALKTIPAGLVAGMTADTEIVLARADGALCLPRSLVRAAAGGSATLQVWTGDHVEKRSVQVGLRGDTQVAILSGLQAGELVVAR
jgi:RND family efflux transporter MFP subunit